MKKIIKNILLAVRDVLDPLCNFREVAVLCYHAYDPHLSEQLAALQARGYMFVPLADVVAWAKKQKDIPHKAVAVTFDDGYADFAPSVLPILKKYNVPVTLFAVGSFPVDDLHRNTSVDIGYHTKTHPNLNKLDPALLVDEVAAPVPMRYFAYPGGNHSSEAVQAVKRAGYEAAFTIRPVLVRQGMDLYLLPRSVVTPEMTVRDVLFYASHAAQWYMALKKIV